MQSPSLLFSATESTGYRRIVSSGNSPLRYLSLDSLHLERRAEYEGSVQRGELLVVALSGTFSIEFSGQKALRWDRVGKRENPFTGNPEAVYVPEGWSYKITALHASKIILVGCPEAATQACRDDGGSDNGPWLVKSEDVQVVSVGVGNWRRDVRFILGSTSCSRRLVAAETLNPPGNWSGFPPHRHERTAEDEAVLEELYHFSVNPTDSYGIQRVYDESGVDEALVVHDGDVVVFPRGYHPTVAPPGTALCYFWAIAGPEKSVKVRLDPRYAWLQMAERVIRELRHEA